eukprot:gene14691-20730_t
MAGLQHARALEPMTSCCSSSSMPTPQRCGAASHSTRQPVSSTPLHSSASFIADKVGHRRSFFSRAGPSKASVSALHAMSSCAEVRSPYADAASDFQACGSLHRPASLSSGELRSTRGRMGVACRNSARRRNAELDDDEDYPLEVPTNFELMQRPDKEKPRMRVRLNVHFRVHSRQILCIGGSQIPMGWSFLSISQVPMTWNSNDIWTVEVNLQAGQRIAYTYVILEEQDWTKVEDQEGQGLGEISYRTGSQPGHPPDVGVIQRQMAIVAWQPGPNRVLQVPSEKELLDLKVGQSIERLPALPHQQMPYERTVKANQYPPSLQPDIFEDTWEVLTTDEEGKPFLDRHDAWGWMPATGTKATNVGGADTDDKGGVQVWGGAGTGGAGTAE